MKERYSEAQMEHLSIPSCRGSVGLILIAVCLVSFLLLPFVTGLIRMTYSQLMVLRAGALIDETLPSASLCLDMDMLADGRLSLDPTAVDTLIRSRLALSLPEMLSDHLEILSVQVFWRPVAAVPDHWLGSVQPSLLPVVTCTVRVWPLTGEPVWLTRSVQLLQTPK